MSGAKTQIKIKLKLKEKASQLISKGTTHGWDMKDFGCETRVESDISRLTRSFALKNSVNNRLSFERRTIQREDSSKHKLKESCMYKGEIF